jgi:iron-sulfur cluster assembly accessory protein
MSSTETLTPVTVSANAARRIKQILSSEPEGSMLRVSVEGGGCSGFRYEFGVEKIRQDEDLVIERDGVTVVVDEVSLQYMQGSEIDFVDELIGASFQIKNPNATSGCGCGTSFAI